MNVSDKNTKRVTKAELLAKLQRGESKTDLERVMGASESDLIEAASRDSEWAGVPLDWANKAEAVMPKNKVPVSIRLDADVLDELKGTGPGWQTRVNAILRAYVEEVRSR